jgi:hypothetical protein
MSNIGKSFVQLETMRAVLMAVGVVVEGKSRSGRWKEMVLRRQRARKKRYCSKRGCVERVEEDTGRGLDFSMRAQVR